MADKKIKKKDTKGDEGVEVTVVPSDDLISNRQYSNFVQVAHSPYDFTLRFCDAPPMYNPENIVKNKDVFPVPIVAEIAIPVDLMPNLIKTLQIQYDKFQSTYGKKQQ